MTTLSGIVFAEDGALLMVDAFVFSRLESANSFSRSLQPANP